MSSSSTNLRDNSEVSTPIMRPCSGFGGFLESRRLFFHHEWSWSEIVCAVVVVVAACQSQSSPPPTPTAMNGFVTIELPKSATPCDGGQWFVDGEAQGRYPVGYISERMMDFFGKGWVQGGNLEVSLVKGIFPGDTITVKGIITEKIPEGDAIRLVLDVWLENQAGEPATAGIASGLVEG